jgi:hypothetical protein
MHPKSVTAFGSRGPSTKAFGMAQLLLSISMLWRYCYVDLPKSSRQRNILWRVDNTTALAYVKKEGATCSPQVLEIAEKVLVKALQMSVRILPVFIPTGENILADAASRFQEIPDLARWGLPTIDFYASNASKHSTLLQLGRV